jgi:hypothetical protein
MKNTNKYYKLNRKRKNKKHNFTRRNKKAGAPKINFAYTYLLLTSDDIINNKLNTLNKYILYKSKICDCVAVNPQTSTCEKIPFEPLSQTQAFKNMDPKISAARLSNTPAPPILKDNTQKLILVMKYDIVQQVSQNIQLLETPAILQQILGHIIINEKTHNANNVISNVIAIYDVCLHQMDKVGYGSVLFNLALICIEVNYYNIPNLILWLGIRIDNLQFSKIAYIYTSAGFKNPYITSVDPWNNKLDFYFISLDKSINEYVTDESETIITYNKTMDLYKQYKKMQIDPTYTCKLFFTLDKSAILRLRMFPYLGIKGVTNITEAQLQREFSGIFKIYNSSVDNNNQYIYKLSLETLAENKGIKYVTGAEESVLTPISSYTFHTHPISLYVKYNVLIGTPSGGDLMYCFTNMTKNGTQFHAVVSIEGLYLISLSSNFILNFLQNSKKLNAFINQPNINQIITNTYEYPFSERKFDWTNDDNISENAVALKIQEYLAWFKSVNNISGSGEIFNMQFISWKQLNKNTIIEINYPSIYNNCFANSKSVEIINTIHGVTDLYNYSK